MFNQLLNVVASKRSPTIMTLREKRKTGLGYGTSLGSVYIILLVEL